MSHFKKALCGTMQTSGHLEWAQYSAGSDLLAVFLIAVSLWGLTDKPTCTKT